MSSYNKSMEKVTNDYLDTIDSKNPPEPAVIEEELTEKLILEIQIHNALYKDCRWPCTCVLNSTVIAQILRKIHNIVRVYYTENDEKFDLAIYCRDGEKKGLYVVDELEIRKVIRLYNYTITSREIKHVIERLEEISPKFRLTRDPDLIAVNNGIFNYRTKTLQEFTPDLVFLTKSHVNYNPNATNITIHNNEDNTDWDIETWMNELSDDPEIVNVLWEILGAIIRPHVRWNKSAWLYSESGNNGKGTLCELMRNLCGESAYASIPLADFGKEFLLEPLTRATAVIVDENDVGTFVDRAANLKAVITNDVIQINRKFKTPIAYQFYGFMVQCLNEFPRIKDKSDSFYRRQLFIPFTKCFTGQERKYIKDDYLHRQEVLEYVLYKVLNMNYYTLSEPQACANTLREYKEYNDPIRQFFEEMSPLFVWDFLPNSFLYDLYKAWYEKNNPTNKISSKTIFLRSLRTILAEKKEWTEKEGYKADKDMEESELLILSYNLKDWMHPTYKGLDPKQICRPMLKTTYRGFLRVVKKHPVKEDTEELEGNDLQ